MHSFEELINIILIKSEHLEERIRQKSDLKNLTLRQLQCIEYIHQLENPTLTELAQKLEITKASASVLVDRLVEHRYIVKIKSDNDRRSAHVHLTDTGDKAAHLHNDVHQSFARSLSKDLTDSEKDILVVLLNKSIKNL